MCKKGGGVSFRWGSKVEPAKPGLAPGGKARRLMGKNSGGSGTQSTLRIWDHLEELVREKVQAFIQAILEEEVFSGPAHYL